MVQGFWGRGAGGCVFGRSTLRPYDRRVPNNAQGLRAGGCVFGRSTLRPYDIRGKQRAGF